ncbi:MAG: hypothetical protein OQK48_07335 [Sulfurimonas sp.]|uniref:hypothetical protein n=1 Tax=Sulfurimonas sp. TaxID=2022749 RepID=UPI0026288690|nr:hypothetical protein [Sulfurimonas sp.]MCW8896042.1 hypothetical protein [Sulfurimonas sp.]MCW8954744.1 hypothetical protein [Sulfurimonas sp.]MCW9067455.1 hypothetical protein [Sulfurimonas sp.]
MWLKSFKIALIEKNTDALSKLMNDVPKLDSPDDIQEAIYLLKAATELVSKLKDDTSHSMEKIKKNLQFLRSTDIPTSKKLDITS